MASSTQRPRTTVITGARSGIGLATVQLLRARGEHVVGIDLSDCDVAADLSSQGGREAAIGAVGRACPEGIDALIECAGVAVRDGAATVSVNYFAAVKLAAGLRPLLARGHAPRAVIVSSSASILAVDENVESLCLADDEAAARTAATSDSAEQAAARQGPIYAASKRALTRWIRRTAPRSEWAGAGILLNGVSPGLVRTPMTIPMLATAEGRAILAKAAPRAVADAAEAEDIALLLAFLASTDNRYLVGQVPFCDGGKDVILRGDNVF